MATKTAETKGVPAEAPKTGTALAEGFDMSELLADSGMGVDDMGVADIAMPYIYILQANSPVVNPGAPAYVEGAQASMLYNNVDQAVYDGRKRGLLFVPAYYERRFVEWVDRDKGGGWVRDYPADSDIMDFTVKNDKGKPVLRDGGNFIVETAYHYGLFHDPAEAVEGEPLEWFQGVFPMKSTALKVNKRFNNELVTTKVPGSTVQAPRFLFPYLLTTVSESKGNNTWWSPKLVRQEKTVSREVYGRAKDFALLLKSGQLTRGAEPGAGAAVEGSGVSDDIPF